MFDDHLFCSQISLKAPSLILMDSSFSVVAIACVGTILYLVYKKFRSNPQYKELAPSSPSTHNWTHHVYWSSHERDDDRFFLNHLHRRLLEVFDSKGFNLFNEITRSNSTVPELIDIIGGARIAIVVLSKDYASSSWCLYDLVEIIKCRGDFGQVVIPIFYELYPYDVKKQTGDFGEVFKRTCIGKTKENIRRWRQVLAEVATIDGYHLSKGDKEAFMVEEITTHISDILNNSTQSNEFKGLVGMKGNMESTDSDEAIGDNVKERLKRRILDSHIRHIEGFRGSIIRSQLEPRQALHIRTRDSKKIPYTSKRAFKDTVYIYCGDYLQYSFASHLSRNFRHKCIDAFVSRKETLDVIEGASATVMILSKSCLSSTLCLDKLMKVFRWQRRTGRLVVPVFYGVSPSEVVVLEHKSADRIKVWKAIQEMRELPAHHSREKCSDCELVDEIVKDAYEKLFPTEQIGINSSLLGIEQLLCKQPWGIRRIGIWGMPGIGKTTLAKAFFDQISGRYEASCFIQHFDKAFHEKGLHRLLDEHFGSFFQELPGDCSSITRPSLPGDKLSKTRTLVVLDDVHNPLDAESFLKGFHWFGQGSLIIITSRDKQVFRLCQINHVYEVPSLNKNEALQLFSQCVGKDVREQDLLELSMDVIDYANGNPSVLSFYSKELKGKNLSEMKDLLGTPYKIPDLFNLFKSSYETLNDREKNIFLDIVCFFVGEDVDYVLQLLEGCGFFPHVGIDVLVEKCLVTISENKVKMHRIIQDVGREIVLIERPRRLWERKIIKSLLEDGKLEANRDPKAASTRSLGTEDIEAIYLDTSDFLFDVNPTAFENMLNLRLLKIYCSNYENLYGLYLPKGLHSLSCELRLLHWEKYPLQSLPQDFDPCHLVELNMPHSQLQKLWGGTKNLDMLKIATLCHSQHLTEVYDICKAPNIKLIDLRGCTRLQVFPATGHLQHLRVVNLSGCREIKSLPEVSPSIEELYLQETGIKELRISIGNVIPSSLLKMLKVVRLCHSQQLTQVDNIWKAQNIEQIDLEGCTKLQSFPATGQLQYLRVVNLSGCREIKSLPEVSPSIEEIYLQGTGIRELVISIENVANLKKLYLTRCASLVELPASIGNATNLEILHLSNCSSLMELPSTIGNATNLKELYLSGCSRLMKLPSSIVNASNLKILDLSYCSSLMELPSSIGNATNLQELNLTDCSSLAELPSSVRNATNLKKLCLTGCSRLKELPSSVENATNLLVELPSTAGNLTNFLEQVSLDEEERLLEEIEAKYLEEMKDIERRRKEAIMETKKKLSLMTKGRTS